MTPDLINPSPRARLLEFLKSAWKSQRNNAYKKVVRGVVNWASFPFEKFDRAVSIHVDRSNFLEVDCGQNRATVSFEIMGKVPKMDEDGNIDDGLLDEFYADAKRVVELSQLEGNSSGDPLVLNVQRDKNIALEVRDADLGVQGLVCSVVYEY